MHANELKQTLQQLQTFSHEMSNLERLETTKFLINAARDCIERLQIDMHESLTTTNRRKLKKRETEVDLKPPVSPVRIAEPSKPKKPKYSGNYGPK